MIFVGGAVEGGGLDGFALLVCGLEEGFYVLVGHCERVLFEADGCGDGGGRRDGRGVENYWMGKEALASVFM